jgi:uncharacterized membrane protein
MMLVEINLLPQKEQKKLGFIVGLIILVVLFLLASIIYYVQIHSTKTSIGSVSSQIMTTQKMEAQLQKQQGTSASANSVTQLKTAINWADKNRIETIPVMRHLTSLLPARGFIQNFTYTESGTVTISVQFDTTAEVAGYLNSLNHSSWIDIASLTTLSTADNSSSTANNGANSSSNTASTSTTSTVDSNTNKKYVPRHTGQFAIQFNRDAVKKAIQSGNNDGSVSEGGFGS